VDPSRRIRVLWLTKGLGPGGAERLLVEQAAARGDGFDYEAAYLLPWKQHLVADLERHGVTTHCLGVRSEADPRWLWRLSRLVRRGRFDVVHVHSPVSAALTRILVRLAHPGVAVVDTEHNRWPSHHRLTRALNRWTYGANDAALAVSEEVTASMPPHARAATRVLTHGIDRDAVRARAGDRADTRAELGLDPDAVVCVTVANLRENKRYPDLLAAARLVVDRDDRARFVTAGQGPLADEIRSRRDALGLADRFAMLGYRDDAPRLMAAADLFVLASSHEGLPVAVMEAFALGVPVVATAVGGVAEAVTDGESGLLVAPGDPTALAEAILRATDPVLRAHLAAGADAAAERFSSAVSVRAIEETYVAAVDRRRR